MIVHFGGHGFQDNMTFALTNTIDRHSIAFPIEAKIRKLSELRNTFVVALLECGREKMAISEVKHGKSAERKTKLAGEEEELVCYDRDLLIVFSCQPNIFVPMEKTIVVEFFQNLYKGADTDERVVTIPGCHILNWKPQHKGVVLDKTTRNLYLSYENESSEIMFDDIYKMTESSVLSRACEAISTMMNSVGASDEYVFATRDGDLVSHRSTSGNLVVYNSYRFRQAVTRFITCQVGPDLF